jgi:hypothetical protein
MMLNHIEVHRFLRAQELARTGQPPMTWPEAVASWYDHVYMPVVQAIRDYDLLHNFPGRTEADLYLWIALHRERLAAAYSLAPLSPNAAVATFAQVYGDTLIQRTVKGLIKGLHWVMGDDRPLGMTEAEFQEAKARHAAGELTLGEVQLLRERLEATARNGETQDGESHNGHAGKDAEDHVDEDEHDDPFAHDSWQAPLGQRIEF